jgi:CBS domain-containing protein
MKARDVMVSPVITVQPTTPVVEVAKLFIERRISAAPVVDQNGSVVGLVSEGDLLRRAETDTERRRSWLLSALVSKDTLAAEYVKAHGKTAADVMTPDVIVAGPEMPLHQIATIMEKNAIRRVPIVENGQLVGIVSRSNLVQAIAGARRVLDIQPSDAAIRSKLLSHLEQQPWTETSQLNVTVNDGVVDLWGFTTSETERNTALRRRRRTHGRRPRRQRPPRRPPGRRMDVRLWHESALADLEGRRRTA